jgi:electron transport complex protein RnfB
MNVDPKLLIKKVDNLLPQTQCRECGYAGCFPYAQAMVEQDEKIDRCLPGGESTLVALSTLLKREVSTNKGVLKEQPLRLAHIRAEECIGCTKCLQACPVDAILGSAKQLHSILSFECTGCGLCVEPCPVDCIDLIPVRELSYQPEQARQRFNARSLRLTTQKIKENHLSHEEKEIVQQRSYVEDAIGRAKMKKLTRLTNLT